VNESYYIYIGSCRPRTDEIIVLKVLCPNKSRPQRLTPVTIRVSLNIVVAPHWLKVDRGPERPATCL